MQNPKKMPIYLHSAALVILIQTLAYLPIVIRAGGKSEYLIGGYRGLAFFVITLALLYVYPKVGRWLAAFFLGFSALSLYPAGLLASISPLAIAKLFAAAICGFLAYQLAFGVAVREYVSRKNQIA